MRSSCAHVRPPTEVNTAAFVVPERRSKDLTGSRITEVYHMFTSLEPGLVILRYLLSVPLNSFFAKTLPTQSRRTLHNWPFSLATLPWRVHHTSIEHGVSDRRAPTLTGPTLAEEARSSKTSVRGSYLSSADLFTLADTSAVPPVGATA